MINPIQRWKSNNPTKWICNPNPIKKCEDFLDFFQSTIQSYQPLTAHRGCMTQTNMKIDPLPLDYRSRARPSPVGCPLSTDASVWLRSRLPPRGNEAIWRLGQRSWRRRRRRPRPPRERPVNGMMSAFHCSPSE